MIESTTAIKGLTGLDVPNLIGGALGRGFGERFRTGDGAAGSDVGSAADRISQIAGGGLSAMKARAAESAAKAEAVAEDAETKAAAGVEKAAAVADKAVAAADAKATAVAAKLTASAAGHGTSPSDGNVAQWAKWLADQLQNVPDIRVYDALRLSDLTGKGPLTARAVWATAQAVLGKDYGQVTVGDLLKRFHP
jgi:hypothetical protein